MQDSHPNTTSTTLLTDFLWDPALAAHPLLTCKARSTSPTDGVNFCLLILTEDGESSPELCNGTQRIFAPRITVLHLERNVLTLAALFVILKFPEFTNILITATATQELLKYHPFSAGWTMFMPSWQFGNEARTRFVRCRAGRGVGGIRIVQFSLYYPMSIVGNCYYTNPMVHLVMVRKYVIRAGALGDGGGLSPGAQYLKHTSRCLV